MSCPIARARHVLHCIGYAMDTHEWNPVVAARASRRGLNVLDFAQQGQFDRGPGGSKRNRKKVKAARAARRNNRRG